MKADEVRRMCGIKIVTMLQEGKRERNSKEMGRKKTDVFVCKHCKLSVAVLKFISLFSGTLGEKREKGKKMGQTVGCAGGQRETKETRETRAGEGRCGMRRETFAIVSYGARSNGDKKKDGVWGQKGKVK